MREHYQLHLYADMHTCAQTNTPANVDKSKHTYMHTSTYSVLKRDKKRDLLVFAFIQVGLAM